VFSSSLLVHRLVRAPSNHQPNATPFFHVRRITFGPTVCHRPLTLTYCASDARENAKPVAEKNPACVVLAPATVYLSAAGQASNASKPSRAMDQLGGPLPRRVTRSSNPTPMPSPTISRQPRCHRHRRQYAPDGTPQQDILPSPESRCGWYRQLP